MSDHTDHYVPNESDRTALQLLGTEYGVKALQISRIARHPSFLAAVKDYETARAAWDEMDNQEAIEASGPLPTTYHTDLSIVHKAAAVELVNIIFRVAHDAYAIPAITTPEHRRMLCTEVMQRYQQELSVRSK